MDSVSIHSRRVQGREGRKAKASAVSPGDGKTVPPGTQPCHPPPPHSTFSRKTGRGQEDGDLSRVYAVLASFLEKMSLRGQLLATPQTRATFSSHCRLSGKLGGRANLDKPLPWSLRECLSCAPSRTVHHLSGGSQGRRERGSL